jgi:transposase
MWEPYLQVIREKCSEVLHILDRFPIVAKMNKALDEVRAGESRRMASEKPDTATEEVAMAPAQARRESKGGALPPARPARYNLKTVRAYLLKEAFQQLWEYNSPAWAGKFSRRVVPPNHAFPHRAHEEDRPLASPASRANS